MKYVYVILTCIIPCVSCTQTQIDTSKAEIIKLCEETLPLAKIVSLIPGIPASIAAYVIIGCDTATGLAKLESDPSSLEWLMALKIQLQTFLHE